MNNFSSNIWSFIFFVFFIAGYFPANMILAFIYGDKIDIFISFFIPFYGLIVMIFNI